MESANPQHLQATDEQRVDIAKGIARGVEFMHTRDPVIIHQDIKPLNVMVSGGEAMLCVPSLLHYCLVDMSLITPTLYTLAIFIG